MGKNQNKNGIFSRLNTLFQAKAHSAIDKVEDPKEMLDQNIREFKRNIETAKAETATVIGNLRFMEAEREKARKTADEWQVKAQAASDKADEHQVFADGLKADIAKSEGDNSALEEQLAKAEKNVVKYNNLARTALGHRNVANKSVEDYDKQIAVAEPRVEALKAKLEKAQKDLDKAKRDRDELLARHATNEAVGRILDATDSVNIDGGNLASPMNEWAERIAREEARLQGREELSADPVKEEFEELDSLATESTLEDELAELKANNNKK